MWLIPTRPDPTRLDPTGDRWRRVTTGDGSRLAKRDLTRRKLSQAASAAVRRLDQPANFAEFLRIFPYKSSNVHELQKFPTESENLHKIAENS